EAQRIPGIDKVVGGGETFNVGSFRVEVFDTPGHTAGHVSYYIPDAKVAFVGDTLFAIGCGRVIEGDMKMMWTSLATLMKLPADTAVYCGHEYTQAN
ncbi:MBL fold metallo-hydrolase, partial [Salmonella enterica]|uniref:MBL fold metallo-hydrolase n=1 Tax=Salmonella enterica TaxID=28901 RepID=UPI003D2A0056